MSEQSTEPSDQFAAEVEDDVEGHVQPPREDDTDHVHSLVRQ
jgi:hypothetical protein